MSISVVTDPEILRLVRAMGFEEKVLVDTTEKEALVFLADICAMCDELWTVKCLMDWGGALYLCDAHLEEYQAEGSKPVHVMLRRIPVE